MKAMNDNENNFESEMGQMEPEIRNQQYQPVDQQNQTQSKDIEVLIPENKPKEKLNFNLTKAGIKKFKANPPAAARKYQDQIKKIVGFQSMCLWGATLAFGAGFAAVSINGATVNKFPKLTPGEKSFLSTVPSITGSFFRIPMGMHVAKTGGFNGCVLYLIIAIIGMIINLILAAELQHNNQWDSVNANSGWYWGFVIGGLLAGMGIATFPMTINVMYWHEKSVIGSAQSLYAGFGNVFPGIFAFLVPQIMQYWTLYGAYIVWVIILVCMTIISLSMIRNPPFFQFLKMGLTQEEATKVARMMGQQNVPMVGAKNLLWKQFLKPRNYVILYNYFISFGGFLALTAYLPTFFINFHKQNKLYAGYYTAAYSVLGALWRSLMGPIADRIGGYILTQIGMVLIIIGSCVFSTQPRSVATVSTVKHNVTSLNHSTGLNYTHVVSTKVTNYIVDERNNAHIIVGLLFFAMGFGTCNCSIFKWIPRVGRTQNAAPLGGLSGGIGGFGGFLIPIIVLSNADDSKVHATSKAAAYGFFIFLAMSIVAMVMNVFLQRIVSKEDPSPVQYFTADGESASPIEMQKN